MCPAVDLAGGWLVLCPAVLAGGWLVLCPAVLAGGWLVLCPAVLAGGWLVLCPAVLAGGWLGTRLQDQDLLKSAITRANFYHTTVILFLLEYFGGDHPSER